MKSCINCVADCTGAGRYGDARSCTYYKGSTCKEWNVEMPCSDLDTDPVNISNEGKVMLCQDMS